MRRLAPWLVLALLASPGAGRAADPLIFPIHRVAPDQAPWRELAAALRSRGAVTAAFTENRWFPFRKAPTVLRGEVRISAERGLSLHYFGPPERTVIIDERGLLARSAEGDVIPPADPRTAAANFALLHVLRLDLPALAEAFEIYGASAGSAWQLALVPKSEALRRSLGRIELQGDGAAVRRIELRRSASQRVEILVAAPRLAAGFTGDELRRFFRAP